MNPQITISEAIPEDVEGIQFVQRATWLATYPNPSLGITVEDIKDQVNQMQSGGIEKLRSCILQDRTKKILVAKDQAKVVGFIRVDKKEEAHYLKKLYILQEYQNKGIGKQLTQQALAWLGTDKNIVLVVVTYNTSAIRFYQSFGFQESGATENVIANLRSGAVLPGTEMIKIFNS